MRVDAEGRRPESIVQTYVAEKAPKMRITPGEGTQVLALKKGFTETGGPKGTRVLLDPVEIRTPQDRALEGADEGQIAATGTQVQIDSAKVTPLIRLSEYTKTASHEHVDDTKAAAEGQLATTGARVEVVSAKVTPLKSLEEYTKTASHPQVGNNVDKAA